MEEDLAMRVTLTSAPSHTIGPMKPDSVNRNTPQYAGLLQTKEYSGLWRRLRGFAANPRKSRQSGRNRDTRSKTARAHRSGCGDRFGQSLDLRVIGYASRVTLLSSGSP